MPAQQPKRDRQHHDAAGDDERDADTGESQGLRDELGSRLKQVEDADRDEHRAGGIEEQQAERNALPVQFDAVFHARASRKRAATQLDQAAMLMEGGPPGAAGSAAASTTNRPG